MLFFSTVREQANLVYVCSHQIIGKALYKSRTKAEYLLLFSLDSSWYSATMVNHHI